MYDPAAGEAGREEGRSGKKNEEKRGRATGLASGRPQEGERAEALARIGAEGRARPPEGFHSQGSPEEDPQGSPEEDTQGGTEEGAGHPFRAPREAGSEESGGPQVDGPLEARPGREEERSRAQEGDRFARAGAARSSTESGPEPCGSGPGRGDSRRTTLAG